MSSTTTFVQDCVPYGGACSDGLRLPVHVDGVIVPVRADDVVVKGQPDVVSASRRQVATSLLPHGDIPGATDIDAMYDVSRRFIIWRR